MPVKKARVMIVDDSVFFREFMSRALSAEPSVEIVGTASSAMEALDKIPALLPDVITLDIEMPKMRGTEFLKKIRPKYPRIQVLAISAISNNVFEALEAGAVDFVSKPNTSPGFDNAAFIRELLKKIRIAMAADVLSASAPSASAPAFANAPVVSSAPAPAARPLPVPPLARNNLIFPNPKSIVAIGASTGGTEAILSVVKDLPPNCPGVLVVQHMPPVFTRMYAERLDKICKMSVREARNGDRIETGNILIAAGDRHMRLRKDFQGYFVRCEEGPKVSGHCPSVDALFESVAQTAGASAVGVILTGMGADGAKNLLEMRKKGAHTIGQDQGSCVVYGMPMVAYNLGGVSEQLPLFSIGDAILRALTKK